jgi:hypothetical protein
VPWLAIAIVLTEMPRASRQFDIDRAQRQIESNFNRFSDPSKPIIGTPMWRLLVHLRHQMQAQSNPSLPSQSNTTIETTQSLQEPEEAAVLAYADDVMPDFESEEQFIFQNMQDLRC